MSPSPTKNVYIESFNEKCAMLIRSCRATEISFESCDKA